MSYIITIPDDIANAAALIAQRSGQSQESLLLNALRVHFPPVSAELQAEFDALEQASDEDFLHFEQQLETETNAAR